MKNRKWILIIAIILILAVVLTIVFINLFRPKDTTQLTDLLYSLTEDGYLSKDNEEINQKIDGFLNDFLTKPKLKAELQKHPEEQNRIQNFLDAYEAFEVMAQFFNREMIFSVYTETYNENRPAIMKSFEKASAAASEMASYIKSHETTVGGQADWTYDMWETCDDEMEAIYKNTANAFSRLAKVYTASVPSKVMNNDLTSAIFKAIDYYFKQFSENYTTKADCGSNLKSLVNIYLTEKGEHYILDFLYNMRERQIAEYLLEAEDITQAKNGAWENFIKGDIKSSTNNASLTNSFVVEAI